MKSYNQKLQESSLSRIWQHINNPEKSFGVISAYRQDLYSEEENLKRHERLKRSIRGRGYGFIEQNSGYTYLDNGMEHMVEEKSCFVPNISLEDALGLGITFEQESILYKDENGFSLIRCYDGKVLMKFKDKNHIYSFKKDDIKIAYSQLIKANSSQRVKFSYVEEYRIPLMGDAYMSQGNKKLAEAKWVRFI